MPEFRYDDHGAEACLIPDLSSQQSRLIIIVMSMIANGSSYSMTGTSLSPRASTRRCVLVYSSPETWERNSDAGDCADGSHQADHPRGQGRIRDIFSCRFRGAFIQYSTRSDRGDTEDLGVVSWFLFRISPIFRGTLNGYLFCLDFRIHAALPT